MDVLIRKQIHGTFASLSSLDVFIEKKIKMDHAPAVGLVICFDDFSAEITELSFNPIKNTYTAYTESDKEIYNAVLHKEDHRDISEIVSEWINDGWEAAL